MIEYISHSSIALWIHYKIWFLISRLSRRIGHGELGYGSTIKRTFSCKFFPVVRWGLFEVLNIPKDQNRFNWNQKRCDNALKHFVWCPTHRWTPPAWAWVRWSTRFNSIQINWVFQNQNLFDICFCTAFHFSLLHIGWDLLPWPESVGQLGLKRFCKSGNKIQVDPCVNVFSDLERINLSSISIYNLKEMW